MRDRGMTGSNKGNAQLLHYGVAIASVALALGLTLSLLPWIYPTTTPLFFIAVMVSAWYGGWRAGLLATVLSTLAISYFFIEPFYLLKIANIGTIARLGVFLVAAGLIGSFSQSRRSALNNARATLQTLREAMEREQAARSISETTQTAATAAKAQLETVLSSITDGFYVLDRNWCYTYVNARLCEMTGMPREELLGYSVWDLFPDAVDTDIYGYLHQAIREQTPLQFENLYLPWNRWFEHRVYPAPEGLTVFVADITDRKQAEETLRQSEERYRTLFESIDDGFCTIEMLFDETNTPVDYRFLEVNPSFEKQTGLEQVVGKTARQMIPGLEAHWYEIYGNVALTGEPIRFENGSEVMNRWFEVYACRVGQPESRKLAVVFKDISDRKQAEATLRESEVRFRQMADTAPVLIWMSGTDKLCNYFNQPWLDFTGRTIEQEMGFGWADGVHPDDLDRCLDTYVTAFDARQPFQMDYRFRHFDGTYRWIFDSAVPRFTSAGEFLGYIGSCIDTQDRKQAEEALRESEERFRTLADNISQLTWMTDDTGGIFWYNQRWFDYTGTTLEQMQGWGWQQVHHPEHLDRVLAHFRHSVATGEPWEDTFPLRGKDGIYRWFLSRALPIRDETGRILHWFGTNTDITDRVRAEDERKQTEEALRESESRLRLIFESAKDYAIFTLDLNGTIASWNSGAERLLGYTEAEAIGCSAQIVFTPEDNAQGPATYETQTALAQGRATNERWHIRKDGSRFWASGLMMPLLDEAGHPQGFVNILQDMTAQRQADERLQLLYETANDLLSAEQPLVLMNSLLSKLSGQMDLQFYIQYLIEPANNRSILQLISSNGIAQEAIEPLQQLEMGEGVCGCVAQEQHQIVVNDVQHSTLPNAQILKPMGVTAYASQPLIVQGRLIGTLAFGSFTRTGFTAEEATLLQAISDQVAVAIDRANLTASLRQQTEQLSQANRIKDEFLAVLSHELRTPLNPILGWSKLLRNKKHDEATVDRALETIERNAQIQTQLIEDLLDVSRILQGKLSLNVSPVNLVFTLQAAIETVRLAAEAKSIQIQTAIEPNIGQVSGDTNRLQQVAWNLLSNAVKFTPQGGQVNVRLERHDNQAQITVSDTGKGIAPEFLPYVFDHFRQADSATTRKFGGLGLGLAIVRQIVELHGGTVFVESPGEGQGATFRVRLPLLNSQPARKRDEPVRSAADRSSLSGLRILVVDDEADSLDFIAFVLKQAQAKVMALSSALEVVQELEGYKPDVLVSDIGMPDMDGYMLLRQVRSLSPDQGGQVLAIALTAYAGEIDQQQALQAGFQRHLSKPIDPQQLIEAICTLDLRRG